MLKTMAAALAAMALLTGAASAQTAPANTLKDMFAALNQCMTPLRLARGADVSIMFMLNRRGGVIGQPRITHAHWTGDDAERKASAQSIAEAFDRCLPASITDALGGAIAGRPIVYRFRGAREDKI